MIPNAFDLRPPVEQFGNVAIDNDALALAGSAALLPAAVFSAAKNIWIAKRCASSAVLGLQDAPVLNLRFAHKPSQTIAKMGRSRATSRSILSADILLAQLACRHRQFLRAADVGREASRRHLCDDAFELGQNRQAAGLVQPLAHHTARE
jgi:hypothetical protein